VILRPIVAGAVVLRRCQAHLRRAPGIGVHFGSEAEGDGAGQPVRQLRRLPHVRSERAQRGEVLEQLRVPQIVPLDGLQGEGQHRPGGDGAHRPPKGEVLWITVRETRWWAGRRIERREEIHAHAHALAVDADPLAAGNTAQHLGRPIAPRRDEAEHAGVAARRIVEGGVVEEQLLQAEGILGETAPFVLHVRTPARGAEDALLQVQGDIEQQRIHDHRRAAGDFLVRRVLGEQQQRIDVLQVVHVRVPLEEPKARPLLDPGENALSGAGAVGGASEAADGKHAVGKLLPREVLEHVENDAVVLRPVPLVVDDPGRRRVGVPVFERQQTLLDGGCRVGRQVPARAEPQPEQVHHVEVAGVLHRVDLGEHAGQGGRSDPGDVDREAGIAAAPLEMGDDVHR